MAFLDETGLAYFWNQILARLNKFVPAESGKGLSSNDYTVEEKEKLAGIEVGANKTIVDSTLSATSTNPVQNKVVNTKFETIQAEVDSKVDSIDGKGLSTEDYTTEEKTKLASIAEGAEVNVQADWNEADTSSDAYIVNKPTIPSKTSDLTNDSGFLTSIPDEYVTETELTAKGYLTSYTETDPTVPAWAKQPKKPSYTADEVGALSAETLPEAINTALAQAKASGEFDGADGKSAYQYAVDGGYTGTEAEFAAKLAQEKFANPNALTFTGAVTGSYDGSAPLSVEIPSGGGAEADHVGIISEGTLSEDVANIVVDGFAKRMIALAVVPYGSTANSGTIKVSLQLGLDNGERLTINPTFSFVTNSAAISWNKIVAFAFVDADTVDVTAYRDGTSQSTNIYFSASSNFWWAKQVYTTGVGKITSVTIGLQADGVIGKNTAYKVVGV